MRKPDEIEENPATGFNISADEESVLVKKKSVTLKDKKSLSIKEGQTLTLSGKKRYLVTVEKAKKLAKPDSFDITVKLIKEIKR